jgi:long-chain acyl-CoA synthetase
VSCRALDDRIFDELHNKILPRLYKPDSLPAHTLTNPTHPRTPARISAPTLTALFEEAARRFGERPAFARRLPRGGYEPVSYASLYERGLDLATGLIELGLCPREHVGLIADNRFEWILADFAVLLAGCADVPRGTDITHQEIAYILDHSDARFAILENGGVLEKLHRAKGSVPRLEQVLVMDAKDNLPRGVLTLAEVEASGRALRQRGDTRAAKRAAAVHTRDLFTIIYTSGTTGTPKGVQLTHANMASQIRNMPFPLYPGERALSILPIWHSYERVFEMISISMGLCTYYTTLRTIADDLRAVRPHVMASAPRLWENLYQKLIARVMSGPPLKRSLFHAARACSLHVRKAERFFAGQTLDLEGRSLGESLSHAMHHATRWCVFAIPHAVLEPLVLSKLREAVGCSEFRGTISGGGALQPHVDEFFNSIGIPVLEGYGLTETSPVLAVRTWDKLVIGTVGPAYPETEIRIVDLASGEILYPNPHRRGQGRGLRGGIHVRGPQVMNGYYKDPGRTAEILRDGWLNTGDIGMVTFNDCLKILGRSKETIVLLNGENIEPVPIEARLVASPLIDHCMVTGQDARQLGALVVPSVDGFRSAGIPEPNAEALVGNPNAEKLLDTEIRRLISSDAGFKAFERITVFRMVPKPFEVGDELTNTFKLKRHVITDRYADLIAAMHSA